MYGVSASFHVTGILNFSQYNKELMLFKTSANFYAEIST